MQKLGQEPARRRPIIRLRDNGFSKRVPTRSTVAQELLCVRVTAVTERVRQMMGYGIIGTIVLIVLVVIVLRALGVI